MVSDGVVNYLADLQQVVSEATGFGVLMFAVRGNASKSKYKFPDREIVDFLVKAFDECSDNIFEKELVSSGG